VQTRFFSGKGYNIDWRRASTAAICCSHS